MAIAVEVFPTLVQGSKGAAALTNCVLKLGMKSASGEVVWATLLPDRWRDAVQNGDEIRVQGDDPKEEQLESYDHTTNVTFKFTDSHRAKNSKYAISLLPKTYEVSCSYKAERVQNNDPPNLRAQRSQC